MSQGGAPVGTAFVEVLPKTDGFVASLTGQLKSAIAQAAGSVDASPITKGLNEGLLALGGAAIAGIYKGIKATQEWTTEVIALQRVTGQTTEEASKLAATADAMGVSVTSLTGAFTILGSKVATNNAAFDKYGIATRDATGETLPLSDILTEVQAKYQSLPEGIDRTSFATAIFGRTGRQLLPVLGLTADQMAEMGDKAQQLGLVLSDKDVAASKALKIAQAELGDAFKGLSIQIGKVFIPILTALTKGLTFLVELIAKIPVPVKVVTLAFLGLNTAIFAGRVAFKFFAAQMSVLADATATAADALDTQTTSLEANTSETYNNIAANESSNATQIGTVESYGQAAQAIQTQTTAMEANSIASGAMAGQLQFAGLQFGSLAGEAKTSEGFLSGLTGIFGKLGEFASGLTSKIGGLFKTLATGDTIPLFGESFSIPELGIIIAAVVGFVTIITKNWNTIKSITQKVWTQITNIVSASVDGIQKVMQSGFVKGAVSALGQAFHDVGEATKSAFADIGKSLGQAFSALGQAFGKLAEALGPVLIPLLKLVGYIILGIVVGAIYALARAIEVVSEIITGFGDLISGIFRVIALGVRYTVNVVIDIVNYVIGLINKFIEFVNRFLSKLGFGEIPLIGTLAKVTDATDTAAASATRYGSALDSTNGLIRDHEALLENLGKTLADPAIAGATDEIAAALGRLGGAFKQVQSLTGVDLSSIKQDLQKYIADPANATAAQVLASIQQVRHAYRSWVSGLADQYGSLGGALDQFANKHNVDIGKMTDALNGYAGQLKQFGNGINTIYDTWGHRAQTLIAYFNSQGIGALGEVQEFNSSTKKQQATLLDATKNVKTQAQLTADAIGNALKSSFNRILLQFKRMWNAILKDMGFKPAFDINNHPAKHSVDEVKRALDRIGTDKTFTVHIKTAFGERNQTTPNLLAIKGGFVDLGRSAGEGMQQGITQTTPKTKAAATAMAQQSIQAAASVLGAHSPATKFIQMGHDIGDGLVNGIKATTAAVTSAATALGRSIIDGVRNGVASQAAAVRASITASIQNMVPTVIDVTVQVNANVVRSAQGNIITGASGFIAHSPTYLVGEGHYPTPAGPGGEAVIPLNQRGRRIMQEAFGDMWRGNGGGYAMPTKTEVDGSLTISDWRNGIAVLDSEMGWEEAVRTR